MGASTPAALGAACFAVHLLPPNPKGPVPIWACSPGAAATWEVAWIAEPAGPRVETPLPASVDLGLDVRVTRWRGTDPQALEAALGAVAAAGSPGDLVVLVGPDPQGSPPVCEPGQASPCVLPEEFLEHVPRGRYLGPTCRPGWWAAPLPVRWTPGLPPDAATRSFGGGLEGWLDADLTGVHALRELRRAGGDAACEVVVGRGSTALRCTSTAQDAAGVADALATPPRAGHREDWIACREVQELRAVGGREPDALVPLLVAVGIADGRVEPTRLLRARRERDAGATRP